MFFPFMHTWISFLHPNSSLSSSFYLYHRPTQGVMWTVLMGGWHQAFCMVSQTVPAGHQASSCSMLPCPGMRGSVRVDFTSLAARGNYMNSKKIYYKPKPKGTPEVALPSTPSGSAPSGQVPQSETSASGTQEVPLHSHVEANNIEKASMDLNVSSAPSEGEDKILRGPETPKSSAGMLKGAIEQPSSLRVKKPNLSTAQRRAAIKAKLLERGEAFDPAKFLRGRKKKRKRPVMGETPGTNEGLEDESRAAKRPRGDMTTTPPSAVGPTKNARSGTHKGHDDQTVNPGTSSKSVSATKMAIVLEGYPEAKLSAEQGEVIENAIMDELQSLEDGCTPSFAGTYMDKGALIISCTNDATKRWLEVLIPRLKPLGEQKLLVKEDILRSTRVFFRAHSKLLKKTPEKVLEMLDMQNPTLKVKEWKVLPVKPDPKGYGFVCFLDEACFNAVRSANSRANLGLWQVSIVSTVKDNAQGPPDQSTPQ
ncbi:hypothetical protein LSTR_LSTR005235 [Laodelphax striatellus]|uniref:DUF4780 domain-containing protein n=1 Tax=Laodelphax striatellus TaxID=195883 RepID=A0A482XDI2_LAOST|nr:hypothetical protein LSTR_LSTR005235 [Laodelphax striatellus]